MDTGAALDRAWSRVAEAYDRGEINSERTLQAHLFSALSELLPEARIFCEPQITTETIGTAIPDIIVVIAGEVVAALELKFVPHHFPIFEGDLAKLARYADCPECFPICLEPKTGRFSDVRYRFGENCLFVFAAIGRSGSVATEKETLQKQMERLGARFKPLVHTVGT